MKKWEKYSEQQLADMFIGCTSLAQFGQKIGYTSVSQGTAAAKEIIEKYNFDTSQLKGQGWNKDNFDYERFQKNKVIKATNALAALTNIRGYRCENCGITEWLGKPAPLCIHHIDGDHLNNKIENLQVLCCNCHAMTDNYCKKNREKQKVSDEMLLEALQNSSSIRQAFIKVGIHYAAKAWYEKAYDLIYKYNIEQFM